MSSDTVANRRAIVQKHGTTVRYDGYMNVLTSHGTSRDSSEAYEFIPEAMDEDSVLTGNYGTNGLFAKIIDTPAEEAVKHGFELNINDKDVDTFIRDELDRMEWDEKSALAIKWARLYGGAIMVMLIDDGRGLEEPVNWKDARGIDELHVFERPLVTPDFSSMYMVDPNNPLRGTTSGFGMPEFYRVSSLYGNFVVHESRCLLFRNGILPERTMNPTYRFWGMPEYTRIKRAMRETITAHGNGSKLLERSVQAVYKMKDLAVLLESEDGETQVMKRLDVIDLCRGILNSIAIDKDGEEYDFKTFQFSGVKDIIDASCNLLSALSNIPQTILFGRSPAGQNATGESDLENWYSYVERIQRLMLRKNMRTVISGAILGGMASGRIAERPDFKLEFSPLWSLNESEKATVEQTKATTAFTKAQTAQLYMDSQVLVPSEVRKALQERDEFIVEDIPDDADDEDWAATLQATQPPLGQGENSGPGEPSDGPVQPPVGIPGATHDSREPFGAAATLVIQDGKVLIGRRNDGEGACGPGGHIEPGETPEEAARREAREEFNIELGEMLPLGEMDGMPERFGKPSIFLCTDFSGTPKCDEDEMSDAQFVSMATLEGLNLFPPFERSIKLLLDTVLGEGGRKGDG